MASPEEQRRHERDYWATMAKRYTERKVPGVTPPSKLTKLAPAATLHHWVRVEGTQHACQRCGKQAGPPMRDDNPATTCPGGTT